MIFQSLIGLRKLRCDVPSGTTQGQDWPFILSILTFKVCEP
jgi:hypothetical protein